MFGKGEEVYYFRKVRHLHYHSAGQKQTSCAWAGRIIKSYPAIRPVPRWQLLCYSLAVAEEPEFQRQDHQLKFGNPRVQLFNLQPMTAVPRFQYLRHPGATGDCLLRFSLSSNTKLAQLIPSLPNETGSIIYTIQVCC